MDRAHLGLSVTALCFVTLLPSYAAAAIVHAGTVNEIEAAVAAATPGTVIEVDPGEYAFAAPLWTSHDGAEGNPIVLRAAKTGTVHFEFTSDEGIVIAHADWVLEHLWVDGVCAGGGCGDAAAGIHIKATAARPVIRQSRITNWAECIKSDRSPTVEPTDGLIEGNEISNTSPGFTAGGTGVDLVGGLRWHIVGNYVHDYARDNTHYGIFVKGGAKDAVIERNLVIGQHDLPSGSGTVGISFGGGGTGTQYCASDNVGGGGCACETFGGIARNNIVLKTTDAGLHTKRACGSVFTNDTVYDTVLGLQVQIVGAGAPVELHNSILGKGITGTATESNNLLNVSAADWQKLYADPAAVDFGAGTDTSAITGKATPRADVTDDYFGAPRPAAPTLGAIELPTTGKVWPWNEAGTSTDPGGGGGGSGSGSGGGSAGEGGALGGGGGDDTSGSGGADSSDATGPSTPGDDGGCSCALPHHRDSSPIALAAFAGLAFVVGARRRRRER